MDNLKTIGISLLALVVAIGSLVFGGHSTPAPTPTPQGIAGPDIASPYLQWGGAYLYNSSMNFTATSSAICAIQNPSAATSTVIGFSVRATGGSLGAAQTFDLSTSTTQYASSSPAFILAASIPSTGLASVAWLPSTGTTTPSLLGYQSFTGTTGASSFVLGANQYLTVKMATGTPGTYPAASYLTGTCTARFSVN